MSVKGGGGVYVSGRRGGVYVSEKRGCSVWQWKEGVGSMSVIGGGGVYVSDSKGWGLCQ